MPIKGTPLGDNEVVTFIRIIAAMCIAVPKSKVRLSDGHTNLSREAQALAYFAGANSIFYGDKLLTTANPRANEDMKLLRELGLIPLEPNRPWKRPKPSKACRWSQAAARKSAHKNALIFEERHIH